MNLEIIDVKFRGDFDKEHILLESKNLIDLSHYIVFYSHSQDDNTVSNQTSICYWFPPLKVSKGDFLRLYTKEGKINSFKNKRDTHTHEYFLFMDSAWFDKDNDAPILFEVNEWKTFFNSKK